MLYQVTSSNANNGSAFAGLTGNNIFWNVMTGLVIILGALLPIIGPPLPSPGYWRNKIYPRIRRYPESGFPDIRTDDLRSDHHHHGLILLSAAGIGTHRRIFQYSD